jgi:DNA polymerase elongation subunit (family B)
MTKKLPAHLKGPFVVSLYDRRDGIIYLKRPDGEMVSTRAYPSFFVHKTHLEKFPDDEFERLILDRIPEGDYVRFVTDPSIRREKMTELINICDDEEVPLLEADVSPVRRWFSDTGALVSQKFRCLFFDLETHPLQIGFDDESKKLHRIISFAAYDDEGKSWFHAAEKSSDEEEIKVIKKLLKIAQDYDVLLAWNGDDYDFFVLRARCKLHKIKVDWRQWNLLDHMRVIKKVLMSIPDPSFKRSFALDKVGENVLGMRKFKLPVPPGKMHRLLTGHKDISRTEGRRLLEEYNRRDVEIMLGIEQKREFLALHFALCALCRTFPNRGSIFPNVLADGILLRLAIQENRHFPSRRFGSYDEDDKYEGAYVMEPEIGFHTDVQVPDFASLYPSIILSWNMSNETKLSDDAELTRDVLRNSAFASATGIRFRTDIDGIIPKALRRLISKRNEYKARAKKLPVESEEYKTVGHLSTAVKVATNSFYGLLGNEGSRYYDREIARSVTLTGQYLIREVMKFFERQGYRTIAGDTDSVFVKCDEAEMRTQLEVINHAFIPELLDRFGCREHAITMDFDKGYRTLLIVAKKKYAGKLSLQKGRPAPEDMEPEIKGLETQRSEQIRYVQRLVREFIDLLLNPEADPSEIDRRLRMEGETFFNTELDREAITITKGVSKHPSEYRPKTTVVRIAEEMINKGREFFVGMKIPYIVIDHKPNVMGIHADDYTGRCDRVYYWTKQILPPILRMVNARFPGYTFGDFKEPRQSQFDFSSQPRRTRKVRAVAKVRAVKIPPKTKVRTPIVTLTVPDAGTGTIFGIGKLARAMPGKYRLRIVAQLNKPAVDTTVDTDQHVSMDCLKEIARLFPAVTIVPKPL